MSYLSRDMRKLTFSSHPLRVRWNRSKFREREPFGSSRCNFGLGNYDASFSVPSPRISNKGRGPLNSPRSRSRWRFVYSSNVCVLTSPVCYVDRPLSCVTCLAGSVAGIRLKTMARPSILYPALSLTSRECCEDTSYPLTWLCDPLVLRRTSTLAN